MNLCELEDCLVYIAEFQVRRGYTVRPFLKKTKIKTTKEQICHNYAKATAERYILIKEAQERSKWRAPCSQGLDGNVLTVPTFFTLATTNTYSQNSS